MIVSDLGFITIKLAIGSVLPEPIVLELTSVETGEVTSLVIEEFFILRNDGVLEITFYRTTQYGPYTYRILGNSIEYSKGKIEFIQPLNKKENERSIDRGKHFL